MGMIGTQFGRPSGVLGRLAGRFMARNNADLNRWIAGELAALRPEARLIVEVGSGPGIGTQELLAAFPSARVVAVDPSTDMHRQLRKRNSTAAVEGRLEIVNGDLSELRNLLRNRFDKPVDVDLLVATHVVYFLRDPIKDLGSARSLLRPAGLVALGHQLLAHMPPVARRDFPASGHRLFARDEEISHILLAAGLQPLPVRVFGPDRQPTGRLALASRAAAGTTQMT